MERTTRRQGQSSDSFGEAHFVTDGTWVGQCSVSVEGEHLVELIRHSRGPSTLCRSPCPRRRGPFIEWPLQYRGVIMNMTRTSLQFGLLRFSPQLSQQNILWCLPFITSHSLTTKEQVPLLLPTQNLPLLKDNCRSKVTQSKPCTDSKICAGLHSFDPKMLMISNTLVLL
jgi:hypothetical protein